MTDRLRLAAQALVDRLTAVHADPAYESVWVVSQMHVGPYAGPTYTEEMLALRRALAEHAEEQACRCPLLVGPHAAGQCSNTAPLYGVGFRAGVEAAAQEAMDMRLVCRDGYDKDIIEGTVNRIRALAPPVPSGPREGER
jgi:hypothetical protein